MTTPADASDDSLALPASDVSIDSEGRVVLNSPELAAAVRAQMKDDFGPGIGTINIWKCKSSK